MSWPAPNPRFKEFVDAYHKMKCRWNHTDGCGWWYENSPTYNMPEKMWSHLMWTRQAVKFLTAPDVDTDTIIDQKMRAEFRGTLTAENVETSSGCGHSRGELRADQECEIDRKENVEELT